MSLQFNDTEYYKGIVQTYEKEIGAELGFISGNEKRLKSFTADANLAWDEFLFRAFKASGTWQYDDSNHGDDFPFIRTNLVAGRRDYTFLRDESGNLILDIHRVMVAGADGIFREISPVDQQSQNSNNHNTDTLINGQDLTGEPTRYEKTGNGILLDLVPISDRSLALKVFINREASYFHWEDTTTTPGCPGTLHRWFAIVPALEYARRNNSARYETLLIEKQQLGLMIDETFGRREKDRPKRMNPNVENCH